MTLIEDQRTMSECLNKANEIARKYDAPLYCTVCDATLGTGISITGNKATLAFTILRGLERNGQIEVLEMLQEILEMAKKAGKLGSSFRETDGMSQIEHETYLLDMAQRLFGVEVLVENDADFKAFCERILGKFN